MDAMSSGWPAQHFSLANGADDQPHDLPHLLRRVADRIELLGIQSQEILDITLSNEIEAGGPRWSATVYWSPHNDAEESTATVIKGIDGCSGGWVVATIASIDGEIIDLEVIANLSDVIAEIKSGRCVAAGIDIPIGLPEAGSRSCDLDARRRIGARRSSVFPAPVRGLIGSVTYAEAAGRSLAIQGKGLSKQAFAILAKIEEVDLVMTPELQTRMVEVHPELCFTVLAGAPMTHHKATTEGREERLDALRSAFPNIDGVIDRRLRTTQPDDLIDALVAAWSARRWASGTYVRLGGEVDSQGLRMEMIA